MSVGYRVGAEIEPAPVKGQNTAPMRPGHRADRKTGAVRPQPSVLSSRLMLLLVLCLRLAFGLATGWMHGRSHRVWSMTARASGRLERLGPGISATLRAGRAGRPDVGRAVVLGSAGAAALYAGWSGRASVGRAEVLRSARAGVGRA